MTPRRMWATAAVLGVASTLMTSLGLIPFVIFLVATLPLVVRGRAVAASGLLTGFGGFWLLLMAERLDEGGVLDNALGWAAVGAVPLAIGLALLPAVLPRLVSNASDTH